jgi:hypothetical protein
MDLAKKKIELEMSFEDFSKDQDRRRKKSVMCGLVIGILISLPAIFGVLYLISIVSKKTQ